MKQVLLLILFSISSLVFSQEPPKILMVLSGYGLEQGQVQPGYEFDEFSKAYLIFSNNGVHIDIASPQGGAVEADKYDPSKPYNQTILNHQKAMTQLENTLSFEQVDPEKYQAVFVVGGKGAMFDLPKNKALQNIISSIYESNGVVSAVCHGPAALTEVKLSNGDYLISGKRINGFTNREESAFNKKWIDTFEFSLEDRLKQRGALFESSPMMLEHLAADKNIITGQNPFSTIAVAEQVLREIGMTPQKRDLYKDEKTIKLIKKLVNDDNHAVRDLNAHPQEYQTELIAAYGYYQFKSDQSIEGIKSSLKIMELARPFNEFVQLEMAILRAYDKLNMSAKIKEQTHLLMKKHSEHPQVIKLLKEMNLI